jgi:hypothetical protein
VNDISEETTLEIEIRGRWERVIGPEDSKTHTLEENLRLLRESAGMIEGDLPADEVRYIIESPDLAQESIPFLSHQLADDDESYTSSTPSE